MGHPPPAGVFGIFVVVFRFSECNPPLHWAIFVGAFGEFRPAGPKILVYTQSYKLQVTLILS